MSSCFPLKNNLCAQYVTPPLRISVCSNLPEALADNTSRSLYSQLILVYCFSTDPAYENLLPQGYRSWCSVTLEILDDCARLSPTVARDASVARILGQTLLKEVTTSEN